MEKSLLHELTIEQLLRNEHTPSILCLLLGDYCNPRCKQQHKDSIFNKKIKIWKPKASLTNAHLWITPVQKRYKTFIFFPLHAFILTKLKLEGSLQDPIKLLPKIYANFTEIISKGFRRLENQ